jgi:hypothetical protein
MESPDESLMSPEIENEDAQSEQLLYAKVLQMGMYLGLVILFITFGIYMSGIMAPAVPLDQVSSYWHHGVHDYLEVVNQNHLHLDHPPTGWAWVTMLGRSDFLNFIGIAILGGITIICYLAIVPTLLRKKDHAYLTMALLEVIVLTLAASGILAVGH